MGWTWWKNELVVPVGVGIFCMDEFFSTWSTKRQAYKAFVNKTDEFLVLEHTHS